MRVSFVMYLLYLNWYDSQYVLFTLSIVFMAFFYEQV